MKSSSEYSEVMYRHVYIDVRGSVRFDVQLQDNITNFGKEDPVCLYINLRAIYNKDASVMMDDPCSKRASRYVVLFYHHFYHLTKI